MCAKRYDCGSSIQHSTSDISTFEFRMTPDTVMEIGRRAIETMLIVSGPMLALSLVIGLVV